MADIIAIGGSFGSANSFGGTYYGVVEQQRLQNYLLVVDNATHGQTVDSVTITQQHVLVPSDALHGHTVDNVTITQQHTIVVNDTSHALTSDTPWLIYNTSLAVDNATHSHTVDNVTIVQQHILVANDSSHSLTIDAVSVTQQNVLVVSNTTHGLTYDGNLAFNQFLLMNKPDDAYHGLISDKVAISAHQIIVVNDAKHRFFIDAPGIINWSDLEKFFGLYKPGTGQYGSLTPAQLAELKALYSNLVIQNGSLAAVTVELGIHKKQYGEIGELLAVGLITGVLKPSDTTGELLVQSSIDMGNIKPGSINTGNLLSNNPLKVLSFEDIFAWLSEDGTSHITEEAGNGETITVISNGILKQGNIEYGNL
jgi:hypothetical protein